MRIVFGLVALAAACGDDGGGLPIGGTGNDGGFTFPDGQGPGDARLVDGATSDAAVAPVDANVFTGRVCLAIDPRKLNTCAATGAGGLTVRLGSASTTTSDNGEFMISGQMGTALVWRVTGPNIVSSYMVVGDYEIPAITRTTYNDMIAKNLGGLQLNPGEGSLMVQVIENGMGRASAFATSNPSATWQPFYDDTNDTTPTTFTQGATGPGGMVWIPGLDVGMASVTVTYLEDVTKSGLPIFDGGITFTTAIFPPP